MKRIEMKIESMAVESNGRIAVTNKHVMNGYLLFIDHTDVKWFYVDENGYSGQKQLRIGTTIEFDGDIHPATRQLHNVIIKD